MQITSVKSDCVDLLDAWRLIPDAIDEAVRELTDNDLDALEGSEGLSARETVHHIVEANIIAASMIIAAMGKSGCTYDWSWLFPDKSWAGRLGYKSLPIGPAIQTLRGLCAHISNVVSSNPDAFDRTVELFDRPGDTPYPMTVAELIKQEVDHAAGHLGDITGGRRDQ